MGVRMKIHRDFGNREGMLHVDAGHVLVVRDPVVRGSSRELEMKFEFGIEFLVRGKTHTIPAANVLQRSVYRVSRTELTVKTVSKISAELESIQIADGAVEFLPKVIHLRHQV